MLYGRVPLNPDRALRAALAKPNFPQVQNSAHWQMTSGREEGPEFNCDFRSDGKPRPLPKAHRIRRNRHQHFFVVSALLVVAAYSTARGLVSSHIQPIGRRLLTADKVLAS